MIYLDNAATSFPKPEAVYETMDRVLRAGGNPGRGGHSVSASAGQLLRETRARVAAFFGVRDPARLIFACNATDALNIAIKGFVRAGDHVVTSELEHNSVLRPLSGLEKAGQISVTRVPFNEDGFIEPTAFEDSIRPETRLVVLTHASNVLGTVQPVEDVAEICKRRGVVLLVDAAQSAGEVPIDVAALGVDMLAFPGHKGLLGPQGTGGLYVREGITLRHWREGGTGTDSAVELQPEDFPERLEAGTANLAGIAGLGEGVRYLEAEGVEKLHAQCMAHIAHLLEELGEHPEFRFYGSRDLARRVPVLSFNLSGKDPGEVGLILDQAFGISVRTGLHCAAPTHRRLGTYPEGTLRVSPGPFTTTEEMTTFVQALREILEDVTLIEAMGKGTSSAEKAAETP